MTAPATTREIHLTRRPQLRPSPEDFRLVELPTPAPAAGEILVRNDWLSVDPYMRGRMNAEPTDREPFPLDAAPVGAAVGEVVASESDDVPVGAWVRHMNGWREHSIVAADEARVVDVSGIDPRAYLGPLGSVGLTAYVGLTQIAPVKPGDVVFISGAAGAVGIHAARIARHLGAATVIGSAGGPEKVGRLTAEFGYDAGIDYRAGDLVGQLGAVAPEGIDVYFDNVGGEHLWAAIEAARQGARIALCGAISGYNAVAGEHLVPGNLAKATGKRITLRGFVVSDHLDLRDEWEELARAWIADGSLTDAVTILDGFESTVPAFIGLFDGTNTGKMLVRLARADEAASAVPGGAL